MTTLAALRPEEAGRQPLGGWLASPNPTVPYAPGSDGEPTMVSMLFRKR